MHPVMWWSLWGVRGLGDINFLIYVYLLAGPILLYLGTSVLMPEIVDDSVDMREHYFGARTTYSPPPLVRIPRPDFHTVLL